MKSGDEENNQYLRDSKTSLQREFRAIQVFMNTQEKTQRTNKSSKYKKKVIKKSRTEINDIEFKKAIQRANETHSSKNKQDRPTYS